MFGLQKGGLAMRVTGAMRLSYFSWTLSTPFLTRYVWGRRTERENVSAVIKSGCVC